MYGMKLSKMRAIRTCTWEERKALEMGLYGFITG